MDFRRHGVRGWARLSRRYTTWGIAAPLLRSGMMSIRTRIVQNKMSHKVCRRAGAVFVKAPPAVRRRGGRSRDAASVFSRRFGAGAENIARTRRRAIAPEQAKTSRTWRRAGQVGERIARQRADAFSPEEKVSSPPDESRTLCALNTLQQRAFAMPGCRPAESNACQPHRTRFYRVKWRAATFQLSQVTKEKRQQRSE